jgi:hypothetical protein
MIRRPPGRRGSGGRGPGRGWRLPGPAPKKRGACDAIVLAPAALLTQMPLILALVATR